MKKAILADGSFINVELSLALFFVLAGAEDDVHDDAEDESRGDGREGDLAEVEREAADARDEYRRDDEEVPVVAEVDVLYHLETAHCDKAVESDADAADDADGDGVHKGDEGS